MAKILVVDDEALLRTMLGDALEEAGYTVVLAENGQTALACAKVYRPDCILLDIMMPELDGYDTCAALKADPELAAIPVILISATTDLRVVDRAEQVGAVEVLPKPVPVPQLKQAVALALNPPQTR
jgi:twitching motility two-component system response regulator PilG